MKHYKHYASKYSVNNEVYKAGTEKEIVSTPEQNETQKKVSKTFYVPGIVFIIFIFAIAIMFLVLPKQDYSSSEKRYLQSFPEVSVQKIVSGDFNNEFESFLADHFAGRNFWVGFNSYYNLYTGHNGSDGVYNCKDDYLINVPVSENDNRIEANANTIAKFSQNVDVPVTMMVAPSTGYIMSDKLPQNHFHYIDDEMFSQIQSALSSSKVNFVDLRQSFKSAAANGEQLYYRTDHHWTTDGAYNAYKNLCNDWKITPTDKSVFNIETYNDFYGTTYSTSGFWLTPPDDVKVYNNPNDTEKNITVDIIEGDSAKTYHSFYFLDHLNQDDKYPIFLDGNHAMEKITNTNVSGGKLLVIKDSFSHCLVPFLSDNFREITTVDLRYYKQSVSELVKSEGYDRVLVMYGVDNLATDTDLVWLK